MCALLRGFPSSSCPHSVSFAGLGGPDTAIQVDGDSLDRPSRTGLPSTRPPRGLVYRLTYSFLLLIWPSRQVPSVFGLTGPVSCLGVLPLGVFPAVAA